MAKIPWWQQISLETWNLVMEFVSLFFLFWTFSFFNGMGGKSSLAWFLEIASIIGFILNIIVLIIYFGILALQMICASSESMQQSAGAPYCFLWTMKDPTHNDGYMWVTAFSFFQIFYQGFMGGIYFLCMLRFFLLVLLLLLLSLIQSVEKADEMTASDFSLQSMFGDLAYAESLMPILMMVAFAVVGAGVNGFFAVFTYLKYTDYDTYLELISGKKVFYPMRISTKGVGKCK